MKVYMRRSDHAEGVPFCECQFNGIEKVLDVLKRGGGVYTLGDVVSDLSYQYVLDDAEAYAEIIVGVD